MEIAVAPFGADLLVSAAVEDLPRNKRKRGQHEFGSEVRLCKRSVPNTLADSAFACRLMQGILKRLSAGSDLNVSGMNLMLLYCAGALAAQPLSVGTDPVLRFN